MGVTNLKKSGKLDEKELGKGYLDPYQDRKLNVK